MSPGKYYFSPAGSNKTAFPWKRAISERQATLPQVCCTVYASFLLPVSFVSCLPSPASSCVRLSVHSQRSGSNIQSTIRSINHRKSRLSPPNAVRYHYPPPLQHSHRLPLVLRLRIHVYIQVYAWRAVFKIDSGTVPGVNLVLAVSSDLDPLDRHLGCLSIHQRCERDGWLAGWLAGSR